MREVVQFAAGQKLRVALRGGGHSWCGSPLRQGGLLLDPITVGHYIGETDLTAHANRARRSFAPPNWQRLQQIRKKYDPDGVFFDYLGPA